MNIRWRMNDPSSFSFAPKALIRGAWERPAVEIPGSARHEDQKKRENAGGYPPSGQKNSELPIPILSTPRKQDVKANPSGGNREHGDFVMELRVHLKICEGCGCLWYRAQTQGSVYCRECEIKLKDFPSPESRKRRGRPGRKSLVRVWAVAEATGGAL